MYKIYFYKNSRGQQPVLKYIQDLSQKTDKDSRIKLNKIRDYIEVLRNFGLAAGEPYLKHLDGEIYELRPLRDRILFVARLEGSFVLLHHFVKTTQKTPSSEIAKAKKELRELIAKEQEQHNEE